MYVVNTKEKWSSMAKSSRYLQTVLHILQNKLDCLLDWELWVIWYWFHCWILVTFVLLNAPCLRFSFHSNGGEVLLKSQTYGLRAKRDPYRVTWCCDRRSRVFGSLQRTKSIYLDVFYDKKGYWGYILTEHIHENIQVIYFISKIWTIIIFAKI